jgi:uncharacterized radical SAM protein YgiQ
VAILPQPDWRSATDFRRFGRPRLGFLINAGSLDSMVANYTANRNRRRKDSLAPGGHIGARPDRALIAYTGRCREAYKGVPVVLGGLEASLRRLSHYDYWEDKVRRSVLLDAKADLLVYGMGERAIVEIADALNDGFDPRDITWVRGTVVRVRQDAAVDAVALPPYLRVRDDRDEYGRSFVLQYDHNDPCRGKPLTEQYEDGLLLLQNPPQPPLTTEELDRVYDLPYAYDQHPIYGREGQGIPALHEIQFSVAHVRGCFGNCSFCAITHHQGRIPTGRSKDSILREVLRMTTLPNFKGYIHDVGGPTANLRGPACDKQKTEGSCKRKDCLYPRPCKNLDVSHQEYLKILRAVRAVPGVKKAFIRSGIRHDYVLADKEYGQVFLAELAAHHVSGLLKTAPEHIAPAVLAAMRKPELAVHENFCARFRKVDEALCAAAAGAGGRSRKPQYIIPYFISAHPGCRLEDAFALAKYLRDSGGFIPDQIQDFYPTPGTLATCIYHTGRDPFTGRAVHVAGRFGSDEKERRLQRALLHFRKPENRKSVAEALKILGRQGEL